MSISAGVVGSKNSSSSNGTTITTTFATKPTTGQAVVIALWTYSTVAVPASVTCVDNQTGSPNGYTLLKSSSSSVGGNMISCWIFAALNVTVNAGTFVATLTTNNNQAVRVACGESFNSVSTASASDIAVSGNNASNTVSQTAGPSGVLAQADEVVLSCINWDETPAFTTFSNSSGFTNIGKELDGGTFQAGSLDYKLPGATSSVSCVYTANGNGQDAAWAMASLEGAGASGAISGGSTGTATAGGTLTGTGALAGTASGVALEQGTLTGAGALAASAAGTASATGTVAGAGALSAAISGAATVQATETGAGALQSSITGAASVSGALIGTGHLNASIAGSCSVALSSFNLIQANISCTASVTAAIAGAGVLASALAANSVIAAQLTGLASAAASVSGVGQLSAVLTGSGTLAVVVSSSTMLTATLRGLGGTIQNSAVFFASVRGVPQFTFENLKVTQLAALDTLSAVPQFNFREIAGKP